MALYFLKLLREVVGIAAGVIAIYIGLRKAKEEREKRNDLRQGRS